MESYHADLQSLKPQEIKFMKFCQGLKSEDRLYEKITEMDPRGWEEEKLIIRKHTAAASLKAGLEHRAGGSGHVANRISGTPKKQQRRYNNENRGRNRTPQRKSQGR